MRLLTASVGLLAFMASIACAADMHENYDDCFGKANCYGIKDGESDKCLENYDCDFMVSLEMNEADDEIDVIFHGNGLSQDEEDVYMAVGFSETNTMENAAVLFCSKEEIGLNWNTDDYKNNHIETLEEEDDIDFGRDDDVTTCKFKWEGVNDIQIDHDDDEDTDEEFDLTTKEYYILMAYGEVDVNGLTKHDSDARGLTSVKVDLTEVRVNPYKKPEEYEKCYDEYNCFGIPDTDDIDRKCDKDFCIVHGNCSMLVSTEEDGSDFFIRMTGMDLDDDQYMAVALSKKDAKMGASYIVAFTKDNIMAYWAKEGKYEAVFLKEIDNDGWNEEDGKVKAEVELDTDLNLFEGTPLEDDMDETTWKLDDDEFYVLMAYGTLKEEADGDEDKDLLKKHIKDFVWDKDNKVVLGSVRSKPREVECMGSGTAGVTNTAMGVVLAIAVAILMT